MQIIEFNSNTFILSNVNQINIVFFVYLLYIFIIFIQEGFLFPDYIFGITCEVVFIRLFIFAVIFKILQLIKIVICKHKTKATIKENVNIATIRCRQLNVGILYVFIEVGRYEGATRRGDKNGGYLRLASCSSLSCRCCGCLCYLFVIVTYL